jgi:hypothetical protein
MDTYETERGDGLFVALHNFSQGLYALHLFLSIPDRSLAEEVKLTAVKEHLKVLARQLPELDVIQKQIKDNFPNLYRPDLFEQDLSWLKLKE